MSRLLLKWMLLIQVCAEIVVNAFRYGLEFGETNTGLAGPNLGSHLSLFSFARRGSARAHRASARRGTASDTIVRRMLLCLSAEVEPALVAARFARRISTAGAALDVKLRFLKDFVIQS
jgi:hypothetical protein